ncbi:hypothetical protein AVU38_gp162 [Ralstonia phage RSL2]|uniref:Uncharacterized protein n=1 Tax=Ralstonia phage RSL2 TaxID=1585840 RepID=A0A0A8J8E5_9CAUD|nr:hypothetical protein AVU38_gp162 [Ralstonia phage RSL2]BAQ02690.1 hypothetical protein [Ralstonia phage RSL2]
MDKKYVVHVVYDGEVLRDMNARDSRSHYDNGMIDLRFQAFAERNEDMKSFELATVKVDKWLMSLRFRGMADSGDFEHDRFTDSFQVNAYLAVLSHFGFDAPYNRDYIRRLEPMIAEIMLQAYRKDPESRISARDFHGVTYIRGEFFRQFDDFLVKYGM